MKTRKENCTSSITLSTSDSSLEDDDLVVTLAAFFGGISKGKY